MNLEKILDTLLSGVGLARLPSQPKKAKVLWEENGVRRSSGRLT